MKRIYFFFFCLLFIQQSSHAQWTLAGTAFSTAVRGLFFNNNDTGYAVGASGNISKTIDGGVTWTPQVSGVTAELRDVHFINDTHGYVSGASGVVLKTINGGATWTPVNISTSATLRALGLASADIVIVGGSAGVIYKTTDGGATWDSISLGVASDIVQLDMFDTNIGYAAASNSSFVNGYIFKTTDGGDSWFQVFSDPSTGLLGLGVADANIVYAGGESQTIIKTTDGGATWDIVHTGMLSQSIRSGFALSGNVAYMVDENNHIHSTKDGGATWNDAILSNGLYSIYFPSLVGYVGNGIGNIYKDTIDCAPPAAVAINGPDSVCNGTTVQYSIDSVAGADSYTWAVPADAIINSGQGTTGINVTFGVLPGQVSVTSESVLCGEGGNISMDIAMGGPPPSPTITFSNDTLFSSDATGNQWYADGSPIGGATDSTFTPDADGTYYTVVTNSYGCTGTSNSLFVAVAQWAEVPSGVTNTLRAVYFINDSVGWACGQEVSGSSPILKTTNNGTSWTVISQADTTLRGVQFVDANTGIIVGFDGTILRSTDGGTTWNSIPSGTTADLRSVSFPSHDTGYACGGAGTILKTTDAGLMWTPQVSGLDSLLINIRFINNDTGYAVQSGPDPEFLNGSIIRTTDGGATWNTVHSDPDIGFLGLAAVDENTAYAGGGEQKILKTDDGGATWTEVFAGFAGFAFKASHFLNDNRGWMVGGTDGEIFYTDNGGNTWTNQNNLPPVEFLGIHFPSSNTGFVVGSFGKIMRYLTSCTLPFAATAITGPDSVCGASTHQYSIDPVEGADSYTWLVPFDATINSGQGTTQINVTFGAFSTQVSVTSISAVCGVGGNISMDVAVDPLPIAAAVIFGVDSVCHGATEQYSIDTVGNAVYYNWSVPGDAVINSGQGTIQIDVTFGVQSGQVSVTSVSEFCGDGGTKSIDVAVDPPAAAPATITGVDSICSGLSAQFSIDSVSGATSYTWSVPADAIIDSGQGTTQITVTFGVLSGQVSATTNNACGDGGTISIDVAVYPPAAPAAITGVDSICSGLTAQFSIDSVSGASSYTWSVPADAIIDSGQGTTQITVTFGVLSGQISATSESACGTGGSISMNIVVNPTPSPTITFLSNILESSDPVGNQWYLNGSPIGGATDATYTPILNGTYYTIVTNIYGCSDTSNSINVLGVGINNIAGSSLAIYPNPSEDECMIYFPKITGGKLRIFNVAGALEFSENNLTGELYKLNTASLPSGFYLVRMYDRENHLVATSKLIVQ